MAAIKFVEQEFDGVKLLVPLLFTFPWNDFSGKTIADYPSFCGAGEGLGDVIIPETIWGLSVSVACEIHDISWEVAEATEADRRAADEAFLINMLSIIKARSNWFMRILRNQRAMVYYNAVDSEKNHVFWNIKRAQELEK